MLKIKKKSIKIHNIKGGGGDCVIGGSEGLTGTDSVCGGEKRLSVNCCVSSCGDASCQIERSRDYRSYICMAFHHCECVYV